uniref:B box-type domain-containing protein n=1 Tax=Caenorhabditis tropicalis TaxID=1561998 RepID=A0A1I7UFI4_9PELO
MSSLECKICVRQFREDVEGLTPRILTSCGHTVCEECAKRLLRGFDIICPFDRKITTVTNTGISYLQKNFTLLEVLQERNSHEKSEKKPMKEGIIEVPCFENRAHEAIYYCEQCEADFCKKCFKQVHTPRIFSRHRKVTISEKPIKLPKCVKHPYNNAEFICKEADCKNKVDLMCHTCILSNEHKDHTYKLLMEELKENEIALKILSEHLEQSTKILKNKIEKTDECVQSFETNGQVFQEITQQITKEFHAKKAQALEDLTDFARCLKKLTEEKREYLEYELQNAQILRMDILAKLKTKSDFCDVKEILDNGKGICDSVDECEDEHLLWLHQYTFRLSDQMTLMIDSEQ